MSTFKNTAFDCQKKYWKWIDFFLIKNIDKIKYVKHKASCCFDQKETKQSERFNRIDSVSDQRQILFQNTQELTWEVNFGEHFIELRVNFYNKLEK